MLNKKAQIFTLIAIALVFLFFVTYEVYSIVQERTAIKTRIKTMDSFIFSTEKNLERQLYVSGFRILFLAEDRIIRTGSYLANFDNFFKEAIFNGTVDGVYNDVLENANISSIENLTKINAGKMNLDISFLNISVSIGQEDPWNIVVYFNAILNLTDKSNLARWNKQIAVKSYINIEGFEDPVYLVNTNNRISRKIYKTPYINYTSGSDITNLSLHLENKYYANTSIAPSFLDRIKGILEANPNGIESFVYIPDLRREGISIQEKSVVDYVYFSTNEPTPYYRVTGMYPWFIIDENHLDIYQVTNLITPV